MDLQYDFMLWKKELIEYLGLQEYDNISGMFVIIDWIIRSNNVL